MRVRTTTDRLVSKNRDVVRLELITVCKDNALRLLIYDVNAVIFRCYETKPASATHAPGCGRHQVAAGIDLGIDVGDG